MRRRHLAATALTLAAFFGFLAPVLGAEKSEIAFVNAPPPLDSFLQRGQKLEAQRRWGEALAYYEDALRQYPQDSNLEQRFGIARLHYDLGRRYADRSYCERLTALPVAQAIDLYGQVLLKLQTHYVESPGWKELFDRGTTSLELALSEPSFLARNIPQQNPAALTAFRSELKAMLADRAIASRDEARDTVAAIASLAEARLRMRPAAVVFEYLSGATNSLDQYSAFLTPDQLNEVYSQIDGNFVGLGVELKANSGDLLVVRVITGSPAERAGIRGGDRIIEVDGHKTQDGTTDQAANMLQGREGTLVAITVAAPGEAPRQMTIRRQRVEVPSVDGATVLNSQGIAYLKLTCFQKGTRRDLETALWRLHREGMRTLIMDLRGNPGGLLLTSVEVANLFIDQGVIVSTHGRSFQEDATYTARGEGVWRMPLTVLIDKDSASAAEILAGAIRDHQRGRLIGERSFGKGSVQGIFQLDASDAGLRLTTAKFFSPLGRPFARVGVEPDIVIHQTARPIDGRLPVGGDAVFEEAKREALRTLQ